MTPQEKAIELVDKFKKYSSGFIGTFDELNTAKQCALIAVDEILNQEDVTIYVEYWQDVRKEIEQL